MVSERISVLLDVIDEERECCGRLIEVSRQEQESVVGNDLESLNHRVGDMREAVKNLHRLQNERKRLLESLAGELDLGTDGVSLGALISRLEPALADKVRAGFKRLAETGEMLYQVNQQTIYLINFSLDLIERQIGAWTGALARERGYGSDGRSTTSDPDAKIIEEKA